ncbi:three-prime repair exonuclease 1 [Fundulus heteroclitus]|uniref:exodeoxyribonuclease III n=1 Tax=Fundulus heteroclitus TaxID=8078 RepID=A0A147AAV7_FUNHE|nr:three-prime repair exonuclease 1 [Fundulus heteroclitus]XP_012717882.1 three-prime repair exonuclease 1 [Fundulus heteroclitus]XP_021172030.1 three-prime repair exonuclease 1 [Fundulus heteroclitus]
MAADKIIVFFDLETTGLDTAVCDIIQLAAVYRGRVFNEHTLPRRALTTSATQVTGFRVESDGLWCHGDRVMTIPLADLLTSFLAFLRSFRCPVVLAAHNAKRFDAPVLTRVLRQYSLLQEFQQVVSGFLDTFLLSKNLYRGLPGYSQQFLVSYFLGRSYNAHNAEDDAKMLQELYEAWTPGEMDVLRATFSANSLYFY